MRPIFSRASRNASTMAEPETTVPRLADVPPPFAITAVSLWRMVRSSGVRPNSSAAIWEKAVSVPCPWGDAPMWMVTCPDASMITLELSSRTSP